jgi:hypothetical protein
VFKKKYLEKQQKQLKKEKRRNDLFHKILEYGSSVKKQTTHTVRTDVAGVADVARVYPADTLTKRRTTQVITIPRGKYEKCSKYKPNEFEIITARRGNLGLIEKKKSGCDKDTECEWIGEDCDEPPYMTKYKKNCLIKGDCKKNSRTQTTLVYEPKEVLHIQPTHILQTLDYDQLLRVLLVIERNNPPLFNQYMKQIIKIAPNFYKYILNYFAQAQLAQAQAQQAQVHILQKSGHKKIKHKRKKKTLKKRRKNKRSKKISRRKR